MELTTNDGLKLLGVTEYNDDTFKEGDIAYAAIRPENFELAMEGKSSNHLRGKVSYAQYFGKTNRLFMKVDTHRLMVDADPMKTRGVEKKELDIYATPESTLILPNV